MITLFCLILICNRNDMMMEVWGFFKRVHILSRRILRPGRRRRKGQLMIKMVSLHDDMVFIFSPFLVVQRWSCPKDGPKMVSRPGKTSLAALGRETREQFCCTTCQPPLPYALKSLISIRRTSCINDI